MIGLPTWSLEYTELESLPDDDDNEKEEEEEEEEGEEEEEKENQKKKKKKKKSGCQTCPCDSDVTLVYFNF